MTEAIADLTSEIAFDAVTPDSVGVLLDRGVVVTEGVISPEELVGMRKAVDTLYFESLPARVMFRLLEQFPFEKTGNGVVRSQADKVQTWLYRHHSGTSQFDPNKLPERLADAQPALDHIYDLDHLFFGDPRLEKLYAGRRARLNIADVSRSRPTQQAFIAHQDSPSVVRLGHVAQGRDTRWTILSGHAPSRSDFDYTFVAPQGSVVTTLERSGPRPARTISAHGTQGFVVDGSEVHEGVSLEDETRHRLAVFAGEGIEDHNPVTTLRNRVVASLVERIHTKSPRA